MDAEFGSKEWFQQVPEIPFGTFTKVMRHTCGEIINVSFVEETMTFHDRFDLFCILPPITHCRLCRHELDYDWLSEPFLVEPMTYEMMLRTEARMNCSNCWGHGFISKKVEVENEETGEKEILYRLTCAYCKEETRGYVSSYYIGWARQEDYLRYGQVVRTIPEILGMEPREMKLKTENVLLHELGFGL